MKQGNFDRRGNFDRSVSFVKGATVPIEECLFIASVFMEMFGRAYLYVMKALFTW